MDDRMSEAVSSMNDQVDEMVRRMNAATVFGEPIQQAGMTLIPVASVGYAFGGGHGWGRSANDKEAPGQEGQLPEGAGAGSGGGGMARPLGYIRIDASGARWEPTMDMTRVTIAGILLAGWMVAWTMQTIRTVFGPRK